MKKISIIVLWCSILLIVAFNSIKVSLKADEENSQNLFVSDLNRFLCL